jgi:glycosyltransferase involved in cell wall biosynthesis
MTGMPTSDRSTSLRRILLVAFHFPPLAGSSGIQRTLGLVRHLGAFGWEPIVLSASPRAYERTAQDLLSEIPPSVLVERSFAVDTARHLTVFGKYPGVLARPDRWVSWRWSAVSAGLRLIRRYRPQVIWSTYPIATAHLIASELNRRTGLPWVADFRDPMAQDGYPADHKTWRSFKDIEERAAARAARLVFVTPGAMNMYATRYPATPRDRFVVVENGYDEGFFEDAAKLTTAPPDQAHRVTLLHSGIVYPSERDPAALFAALSRLRNRGVLRADNFRIRFRAPVHEALLARLAFETGTADLIEVLPSIPYREALAEMLQADALMVMQGANCNEQIPAKVYEYLRAGRPILGLADPVGDTAGLLRHAGVRQIGKLEDSDAVESALSEFVEAVRAGRAHPPEKSVVAASSRRARTGELAAVLDQVMAKAVG